MPIIVNSNNTNQNLNQVIGGTIYQTSVGQILVPVQKENNMTKFLVSHKSYSINSKKLEREIISFVKDIIDDCIFVRDSFSEKIYDYVSLIDFTDRYMDELLTNNHITHFDIISDTRNNKYQDLKQGHIIINLSFKQYNCLNISKIDFHIFPETS